MDFLTEVKEIERIINEEKIISRYTKKNWLKSALKKDNFEGPSGNKVIAYVWPWKWEAVDANDGTVDAKVSDWSKAEKCSMCNRKIVHIFYVWHKEDESVMPYGFDHVHKVLGITKELSKSVINKIIAKVSIPNGQEQLSARDSKILGKILSVYNDTSHETIHGVINNYRKKYGRNPKTRLKYGEGPLVFNVYFNENDKKYVILSDLTQSAVKKIDKLFPPLKKVSDDEIKDHVKKRFIIDEIYNMIKNLARDNVIGAQKAFRPYRKFGKKDKGRWGVNFKERLILIIPKGSYLDSDNFVKYFSNWAIGDADLVNKMLDTANDIKEIGKHVDKIK